MSRRDGWRFRDLVREGYKNIASPRSRLRPLLYLSVAFAVAIPILGAWDSVQFRTVLEQESLAGRNVIQLTSLDPQHAIQIDRKSCESLTSNKDVSRAGIEAYQGSANVPQIGADLSIIGVSQTLIPDLSRYDVVVGSALPSRKPFELLAPSGTLVSATPGVEQPDAIGTNVALAVPLPLDVTASHECIVVLQPYANAHTVANRLRSEISASGGAVAIKFASTGGVDIVAAFIERIQLWLPVLLALLGGVSAALINRLRLGEWAAYRLSGSTLKSVLIIQTVEQAFIVGVGMVLGVLAVVALSPFLVSPSATIAAVLSFGLGWIPVSAALTASTLARRPTDLAREH